MYLFGFPLRFLGVPSYFYLHVKGVEGKQQKISLETDSSSLAQAVYDAYLLEKVKRKLLFAEGFYNIPSANSVSDSSVHKRALIKPFI